MVCYLLFFSLFFIDSYAEEYFKEEFSDNDWERKWISSEHYSKVWGKFILFSGKADDSEIIKGIQTSEDSKFYGLSTKFAPFSNEDKLLVIQFSIKYPKDIKCAGGYIKLFDCSLKPKKLHSYTPYLIMFGPDICGPDKKVQVVFTYRERTLKMKREIRCKDDRFTHLYTLIIKPNNAYIIKIDNKIAKMGWLEEDWDFLPPRELKSNEKLYDSDTTKQPNLDISDLYKYDEICGVGFDLWQVNSGSVFDNILITDDEFKAEKHGDDTWGVIKELEMNEKTDEISTSKITTGHDEF